MAQFRVDTQDDSGVRLRSSPATVAGNIIATLPEGQLVEKISDTSSGWSEIRVTLHGAELAGFAVSRFLIPAEEFHPPPSFATIKAVHLREGRQDVTRDDPTKRAFPLGENGMPHRSAADEPHELHGIINYLDVERHNRYAPTDTNTFCNIYAYDYCYLAGVYLPRVWWSAKSVARLATGQTVTPAYGDTILEVNANGLLDWFQQFGDDFAWRRTHSLDEIQTAANEGKVGVIVAQRVDLNRSGHIVAVAPEAGQDRARRAQGSVVLPLQSQAGRTNRRLGAGTKAWWQDPQFRSFGYFIHD